MLPLICVYGIKPGIQQVQRLDAAVRLQLHDQALEDLDLEAVEHELARDRDSRRSDAAATLEEVPEGVVVDAVARLRKKARVRGLLGRCDACWQARAGEQEHREQQRECATESRHASSLSGAARSRVGVTARLWVLNCANLGQEGLLRKGPQVYPVGWVNRIGLAMSRDSHHPCQAQRPS